MGAAGAPRAQDGMLRLRIVHVLDFRVVKGRIQIRGVRDNRATAYKRRVTPKLAVFPEATG
jgi:hypothetical protein